MKKRKKSTVKKISRRTFCNWKKLKHGVYFIHTQTHLLNSQKYLKCDATLQLRLGIWSGISHILWEGAIPDQSAKIPTFAHKNKKGTGI